MGSNHMAITTMIWTGETFMMWSEYFLMHKHGWCVHVVQAVQLYWQDVVNGTARLSDISVWDPQEQYNVQHQQYSSSTAKGSAPADSTHAGSSLGQLEGTQATGGNVTQVSQASSQLPCGQLQDQDHNPQPGVHSQVHAKKKGKQERITYRLVISYLGAAFEGWAWQPPPSVTVEGRLSEELQVGLLVGLLACLHACMLTVCACLHACVHALVWQHVPACSSSLNWPLISMHNQVHALAMAALGAAGQLQAGRACCYAIYKHQHTSIPAYVHTYSASQVRRGVCMWCVVCGAGSSERGSSCRSGRSNSCSALRPTNRRTTRHSRRHSARHHSHSHNPRQPTRSAPGQQTKSTSGSHGTLATSHQGHPLMCRAHRQRGERALPGCVLLLLVPPGLGEDRSSCACCRGALAATVGTGCTGCRRPIRAWQ